MQSYLGVVFELCYLESMFTILLAHYRLDKLSFTTIRGSDHKAVVDMAPVVNRRVDDVSEIELDRLDDVSEAADVTSVNQEPERSDGILAESLLPETNPHLIGDP